MNKIFLGFIAVLIALGIIFFHHPSAPSTSVSNETDMIIRERVTQFGSILKNVSLLAPKDTLRASLQSEYGSLLTPELLTAWQQDPSQALGRNVSSPWPDRINVHAVTKVNDTTYTAEGVVVEVTSNEKPGEVAATYPVTLTLENRNGTWLISKVVKGDYSEISHRQTIIGVWECLPHRNTTGPQTMECAFGIKTDTGKHYAVDTSLLETFPVDFPTGDRVQAEGIVTPANQLNSDMWQRYNMEGIIHVTSIKKI